jgi:hypothetical protein
VRHRNANTASLHLYMKAKRHPIWKLKRDPIGIEDWIVVTRVWGIRGGEEVDRGWAMGKGV